MHVSVTCLHAFLTMYDKYITVLSETVGMTNILTLQHVRYNLQYNIEAKFKKK